MTTTQSENILIGRQADGTKVYVSARFEHLRDRTPGVAEVRETTAHGQTTERLRVAFSGVTVDKYGSITRDGSWRSCGQVTTELLYLTTLTNGWTVSSVKRLYDTWNEWHLNDMRAACDHQTPGPERALETTPPCPITGYRYGHSWLFKSIPQNVFMWISEAFEIEPPEPGSVGV